MKIKNVLKTVAAIGALTLAGTAQAYTCLTDTATVNGLLAVGGGSAERKAVSEGASCYFTLDSTNVNSGNINSVLGGSWTSGGTLSESNGSNLLFTVTSSNWGTDLTGTWEIAPSFWSTYGDAWISLHVGEGEGSPDQWMFHVTQGATSGSFAYERYSGGGGGLSNLFLWGGGTPTQVPEPATLGLLGLGLAGVGFARRRKIAA